VKKWIAIALLSFSLFGTGCKQGLGERCQVNADCSDGLTCSNSDPKVCVTLGGGSNEPIDATVPDAM
jgi:hypothetical protein